MSAVQNGWEALEVSTLLETPYLRVMKELVATPTRPDGVDWTVVRRKQAAVVAPREFDGRYILIRQERISIRGELWEFPAGQIDGEITAATCRETAERELAEEAGCRFAGELIPLGAFWPSAGFTDERSHLFLATDVEPTGTGIQPDAAEAILEVGHFTPDELKQMIRDGEICDANTLCLFARLVAADLLEAD